MKILLSAYACEPNKGSEPGVGWHWASEIVKLGHEVWVLTRKNNQQPIEDFYKCNAKPKGLNYIYYDVPKWLSWWKKGGRGVYLYYLLWQIGIYSVAKNLNRKFNFDLVHHCTFVSVRQPSFLGGLEIPFIFGPVAGGERIPNHLRKGMGLKGRCREAIRDVLNKLVAYDPLMLSTFRKASIIYVTSNQTKTLIPKKYHFKTKVQLAIGVDVVDYQYRSARKHASKFLYVGNFIHLKGISYGLNAFSEALKKHPGITLTLVGRGDGKSQLVQLADELGISSSLTWVDWVNQSDLMGIYKNHDVLLFPSLRDSGGMVVLEAMSFGLPVICTTLGGPGVIVNNLCGFAVAPDDLVASLTNALNLIIQNTVKFNEMSSCAVERSHTFSWARSVGAVYNSELRLFCEEK